MSGWRATATRAARDSLAELLRYVPERAAAWVGEVPTVDAALLERLDIARSGHVCFDAADNTRYLHLLGAALMDGSTLRAALKGYVQAKVDEGATDLLEP